MMANRVQPVPLEVEVQQGNWDFQDQRVWQSVPLSCFFLLIVVDHLSSSLLVLLCGERLHCFEVHHVFGLIQGDGGKLGEAGSAGPPGQRVSGFISNELLSLTFDNKALTCPGSVL